MNPLNLKIYSLFTAIVLSISTFTSTAQTFSYDGLNYRITDLSAKTAELTENPNATGHVIIPAEVEYSGVTYSVTSIGDRAFSECDALTSVSIPNGVVKLGNSCFSMCFSLSAIDIPESVTTIGSFCFSYCFSLTSVNIPTGLSELSDHCFQGCFSLSAIDIPFGITKIGERAFDSCSSLTSMDIPDSVTELGYGAFEGCSTLITVKIPDSVISLGIACFNRCSSLISIDIPSQVTSLGFACFSFCTSLTSANFHEGLIEIGVQCFQGCSSLTEISIPNSVTTLNNYCFSLCNNLKTVNLGRNVEVLGDGVFMDCKSLEEIDLSGYVSSIGKSCFSHCTKLKKVDLGDNLTYIDSYAFYKCDSLTEIIIPKYVTFIGDSCLCDNKNLKNVVLGESITKIGRDVFANDSALQFVECLNPFPPRVEPGDYDTNLSNVRLYVDGNSVDWYRNSDFWEYFFPILPFEAKYPLPEPIIIYNGRFVDIYVEYESEIFYSVNDGEFIPYSGHFDLGGLNTVRAYAQRPFFIDSDINLFQPNVYGSDYYAEIENGGSLEEAYLWSYDQSIIDNPNLLVYTHDNSVAANLSSKVTNIVVNDHADRIKLNDAFPWYCPYEFEAANVTYTHSFSKQTAIDGGCAGWETIALPFDVQNVTHEKGDLHTFAANSDDYAHRFWLYKPNSYEWQPATAIEANVPYLIAMPNNPVYYDPFNITGEVTFSAQGATIPATPAELSHDFRNGYKLNVNYLNLDADTKRLVVNDEAVDGNEPGSCFVADQRAVRPFEAYLTAPGQSLMPIFNTTSLAEGLMTEMALRVWCDTPQSVSIAAPFDAKVNIYDISGRAVRTVKVPSGETVRLTDLPSGLYIIAKTKIAIIR